MFNSFISAKENVLRFSEIYGLISFIRRLCPMSGCIGFMNIENGKTLYQREMSM